MPCVPRSLLAATVLVLAASSCRPAAHSGPPPSPAAQPGYTPGLGEIMTLTQMRHSKLWYAADAKNWELAAYEVDELEEGLADAVAFHPTHKGAPRPISELVPEFMEAPVSAVRAALTARDAHAFVSAYDALTEGCNGCHGASGFGFNRVTRPAANPYSNQVFAAPPVSAQ